MQHCSLCVLPEAFKSSENQSYLHSFYYTIWREERWLKKQDKMGQREQRVSHSWGEGGVMGKRRGCMIKAYILKSLTSPLVWLMRPTSQSDRGKGLEKWCNYCFLNRGLKRPVWRKDLAEILRGIPDSRLSPSFIYPHCHTPWSLSATITLFPGKHLSSGFTESLTCQLLSWWSILTP